MTTNPPEPRESFSLRGAEAQHIAGRFWSIAGVLVLAAFAAIVVVSFVSALNDNARIVRLKDHGIPVVVTVTSCVGNIGGSGSNAAGYTCRGSYRVHGVRYEEVIASKSTLSAPGTKLRRRRRSVATEHGGVGVGRREVVVVRRCLRGSKFVGASLRHPRRDVPRSNALSSSAAAKAVTGPDVVRDVALRPTRPRGCGANDERDGRAATFDARERGPILATRVRSPEPCRRRKRFEPR